MGLSGLRVTDAKKKLLPKSDLTKLGPGDRKQMKWLVQKAQQCSRRAIKKGGPGDRSLLNRQVQMAQ